MLYPLLHETSRKGPEYPRIGGVLSYWPLDPSNVFGAGVVVPATVSQRARRTAASPRSSDTNVYAYIPAVYVLCAQGLLSGARARLHLASYFLEGADKSSAKSSHGFDGLSDQL